MIQSIMESRRDRLFLAPWLMLIQACVLIHSHPTIHA